MKIGGIYFADTTEWCKTDLFRAQKTFKTQLVTTLFLEFAFSVVLKQIAAKWHLLPLITPGTLPFSTEEFSDGQLTSHDKK